MAELWVKMSLKNILILAGNINFYYLKSVYDCYAEFEKSLFIRVSENDKVNDCITIF